MLAKPKANPLHRKHTSLLNVNQNKGNIAAPVNRDMIIQDEKNNSPESPKSNPDLKAVAKSSKQPKTDQPSSPTEKSQGTLR